MVISDGLIGHTLATLRLSDVRKYLITFADAMVECVSKGKLEGVCKL